MPNVKINYLKDNKRNTFDYDKIDTLKKCIKIAEYKKILLKELPSKEFIQEH